MQLDTILTAGARQIGLWQSTTKVEEVFDLLNCGPNNRFTILTDEGPVVVHNCCQTIARDILAPALLDAEQDGYLPVLSVHDEGLTETPDTPNYTVDRLVWHLAKGRSWTKGLPLAAEGFETYRYFKE